MRAGSRADRRRLGRRAWSARWRRSGLQGLDLLDLPLGGLLTAAPWKAAAATSLVQSLLIAIVAMIAGIVALRSRAARGSASAVGVRAGRRRAVARLKRARRDGVAAMADPPGGVPAWRRRRLLGRRARAAGGDGMAAGATAASGPEPVLARRDLRRGRAGADRACAGRRPAREFWRADRQPIRHHPVDQAGAGRRAARARGAEPLSPDAGAGGRSPQHAAAGSIDRGRMRHRCWLFLPSSPAGASRRRRARWQRLPSRRWRSISIPRRRCSRCWFRRAKWASTILCCN